ncbi:C2H2 transcription factor [Aspergillus costaricaensis CBS 115574]|uniref:C2H2 transcription factor n=1 Tax=Aspergillus costaricaensis CBS 115574 TaxID=1448317 RepID=A0ACD1IFT1_9EURO|nr:C2H2 transcription factor [Aspergillus costaricaensis CBS 115574]RAK89411.1 C2H2 transcription factor [Aspergillus costaricaensis CBS 115574]
MGMAKKNGSKVRDLLFHTQDLSVFQDLDIFNNNLGLNDDWYFPSEPSIQIYTGDLGFNNMPTASIANPPNAKILPSCHSLSRFINGFFDGFYPHLPMVHIPTFRIDECDPEMLLAMCALGAESRHENRKAAFLFRAAKEILHERASRKEWRDTECPFDASEGSAALPSQQTSTPTDDTLRCRRTMREARCAFLLIAFATWRREESIHREAFNLQSFLARCVRACQLNETEQSLVADGGSWHLWIQQETDRRVKLLSFAFLNLQSIAFGTPPAILADEINVRLPCSSLEWIAPNEQKWRLARRPGHREQMSFQDSLCNVIKNTPDINSTDTLPIPSPLSNYIILHAIIQRILLAYHTLGPYNDANNIILNGQKNVIRNSLHAWTSLWQRAPESSLDPRNPNGPVTYTSTALLGVAYIRLGLDLGSYRILQSHDATDIAKRLLQIPRLPPGPHLLPAILHATHALSIPVKLGVNFVARSHAFVWSVQHSLCGLEFAIFLSKWLFCIADSQTRRPLNAHEARLVNWISDIVEEGRTSADDDLWSSPSNLSDCSYLGIAVVRLWARLIRGNGQWSLFEVVSDGLDLYANTLKQGMRPDNGTDSQSSQETTPRPQAQVLVKWSREQDRVTSSPDKITGMDNPMETGPALKVLFIISSIPGHAHDILVVERYGFIIDGISPPLLLFGVRQPAWSTNQTQKIINMKLPSLCGGVIGGAIGGAIGDAWR